MPVVRFSIAPPGKTAFTHTPGAIDEFAVSPDGRSVAFLRTTSAHTRHLCVTSLVEGAHTRRLTDDAVNPGPPAWTGSATVND